MNSFHSAPSKKALDAMEAAVRKYGHPCAIADLDSYSKRSEHRRRFLDSALKTCRDLFLQRHYPTFGSMSTNTKADMNCELVKALKEYHMPVESISDEMVADSRNLLSSYGRPIPPKQILLQEHQIRVWKHRKKERKNDFFTTSKNVTKEACHVSERFDWGKLKQVAIRDLKIFETKKGKYIEGKLLVEPFTPFVGCTTIMEDANGDVLLIALYNFLPDGISGIEADPIANIKIPKGATVRIAEPFLKVFQDGSRGVRIDNPSEISVIMQNDINTNENRHQENAKANGNAFFQKKLHNAAIDSYIDGLRKADFIPTLLSNRSQAFIKMKIWEDALADAAASLTIRPNNKKTWARYRKALEELQKMLDDFHPGIARSRLLETILVTSIDINSLSKNMDDASDAELLKKNGNNSFMKGEYVEAVRYYSQALLVAGKTCRALLSNWSQCCLNIGSMNDCIAASASSLRISYDEKAFYRLSKALTALSEPSIAQHLLAERFDRGVSDNSKLVEIIDAVNVSSNAITSNEIRSPHVAAEIPRDMLPNWYEDVETFTTENKGRGVRAKINLVKGQVVLIEHAIAAAESKNEKTRMDVGPESIQDITQSEICETIMCRSERERLLTSIVNNLYDGVNSKPLVPFSELIPSISSTSPLLTSHHEHMLEKERVHLTSRQIQRIVETNSFGHSIKDGNGSRSTSLFPGTAMFNHSKDPVCGHAMIGDDSHVNVIVTTRAVQAGEELTICYCMDEEKARKGWGF